MNCQDVLGWLETGGWLQQRRARRHARRCASCAAAVAAWRDARRRLQDAPELTPAQQQAWRSAAGEAGALPRRGGRKRAIAWAGAAAVLACVALAVWFALRPDATENHAGGDGSPPQHDPPRDAVTQRGPTDDTGNIRAGFEQLSDELAELQSLAATLDERRLADDLLAAHERRFESPSAKGENP